jgi:Zn finger protein HypA/HybF involved in hydrogenase expression
MGLIRKNEKFIIMTKKMTLKEIIELTTKRNHSLIDSENFEKNYKDVKSKITINCKTCQHIFSTTMHSYKNAKKTGCPYCKSNTASKTHKNKQITLSTRNLIGAKASQRPGSLTGKYGENHPRFKNAEGRDKTKRSTQDYCWINTIKKIYHKKCVLSGDLKNVECHHLDGWNLYPDKRYSLTNGVTLSKKIHNDFHLKYGFGFNNEGQFIEFCFQFYNLDWVSLKQQYLQQYNNPTSKRFPLAAKLKENA